MYLAIPEEVVDEQLVLGEVILHIECKFVGFVGAKETTARRFLANGKLHVDVGIVGKEVAPVYLPAHREAARAVRLLVGRGSQFEVLAEYFFQISGHGGLVYLHTLNLAGSIYLVLALETVDVGTSVGKLLRAYDVLLVEEGERLLRSGYQFRLISIDILHEQGDDVLLCGREQQLVGSGEVANHKEDVDHTLGKFPVGVFLDHGISIADGTLSRCHERTLKHGIIELVERDESSHLFVFRLDGCVVGYLDDTSFVASALRVDVAECAKGVEHFLDK